MSWTLNHLGEEKKEEKHYREGKKHKKKQNISNENLGGIRK